MIAVAVAAVVVGVGGGGCTTTERDSARRHALNQLREDADGLGASVEGLLRGGASADDALERLRAEKGAVIDGRVADGTLTVDAVFIEKGSDGGGLTYEDVILRACVRYTARPAATAAVRWRAIPCPASIDDDHERGPYDQTVLLGA